MEIHLDSATWVSSYPPLILARRLVGSPRRRPAVAAAAVASLAVSAAASAAAAAAVTAAKHGQEVQGEAA